MYKNTTVEQSWPKDLGANLKRLSLVKDDNLTFNKDNNCNGLKPIFKHGTTSVSIHEFTMACEIVTNWSSLQDDRGAN